MSRRHSPKVAQRNAPVLARIQALKADHPFWGYRRIWAQLRFEERLAVNKKRVLRLMRAHGLLVTGNPRLKATRTPMRSKPRPTAPNQWWGIDMTKVMVEPIGWVYVVIVLDWYTKKMSATTLVSRRRRCNGWPRWTRPCSASSRSGAVAKVSI
jgi:hypothetical protein